jgi:hypothetical protein
VILSPGRFFDPLPAINPALVRLGDFALAAE